MATFFYDDETNEMVVRLPCADFNNLNTAIEIGIGILGTQDPNFLLWYNDKWANDSQSHALNSIPEEKIIAEEKEIEHMAAINMLLESIGAPGEYEIRPDPSDNPEKE